jgi:peptidoglycan/LPS O-acetylase OafA/YrhL
MTSELAEVRIRPLDGLRGIAILLVLVFHGFYLSASADESSLDLAISRVTGAGWTGVDLFFVLSGFFITGILLEGREAGANPVNFYARRALRILPVYFGFLIFLMYLLPLVAEAAVREQLAILRGHQAWYWTFLLNVKLALYPLDDLGRFGNGHLWSLMVEEQFYLVWPALVLLFPRRALLPVLISCVVAAPLFRYAVLEGAFPRINNGLSAYVLMPARMDALAFGAMAAMLARHPTLSKRTRPYIAGAAVFAAAGLIAIALYYERLWWFDRWTQILCYTCIAVLFFLAVERAASMQGRSLVSNVLSSSGLLMFGRYSYALYVVHFQVMYEASLRWDVPTVAGTDFFGRLAFTLATGAIATAVAAASWHFYESKFLAYKKFVPYGRVAESPSDRPPPPERPEPMPTR